MYYYWVTLASIFSFTITGIICKIILERFIEYLSKSFDEHNPRNKPLVALQTFTKRYQVYYEAFPIEFTKAIPVVFIFIPNKPTLQNALRFLYTWLTWLLQIDYWLLDNLWITLVTSRIPKSKGFIDHDSRINPNYLEKLSDAIDIDIGIKKTRDSMENTCSIEVYPTKFLYESRSSGYQPDQIDEKSFDKLKKLIQTTYHFTGSCRMSSKNQENDSIYSVVNALESLQIYGTKNLRVVGSPVFPNGISTSNSATCAATGYICANQIYKK